VTWAALYLTCRDLGLRLRLTLTPVEAGKPLPTRLCYAIVVDPRACASVIMVRLDRFDGDLDAAAAYMHTFVDGWRRDRAGKS